MVTLMAPTCLSLLLGARVLMKSPPAPLAGIPVEQPPVKGTIVSVECGSGAPLYTVLRDADSSLSPPIASHNFLHVELAKNALARAVA